MAKNITVKVGNISTNFLGVKKVECDVIGGGKAVFIEEQEVENSLQKLTVTENGMYTPDDGFIGFSEIDVDVAESPEPPDPPVINLQDITVTQNGNYTAEEGYDGLGTVDVEVVGVVPIFVVSEYPDPLVSGTLYIKLEGGKVAEAPAEASTVASFPSTQSGETLYIKVE